VSGSRRILFLGAETSCHVTRWVRNLQAKGHDVLFATLHPDSRPSAVSLVSRRSGGATTWSSLLRAGRRARLLARRFEPDVAIAYYLTSYGVVARLAGLRPSVGVAVGGDILVDDFDSALHRLRNYAAARFALGGCAGLCVWGRHVADRAERLGFPSARTFVQPRGVDTRLFPFRAPRGGADGAPLRVLSTRWFKPLYRVETLVEALSRLHAAGIPFEARLVGEGPEQPCLEALVESRGLRGCVTFPGRLAADDMAGALAWADVYVSTSCTDGASSSLFEALSVGLYPLVSDIPANRNFVRPGVTGDLFAVGDAADLARALTRLSLDRGIVRRGVEAARGFVASSLDYSANMTRIDEFVFAHAGPARRAVPHVTEQVAPR
jgi:glycosyltransferase involved in cell wall biosynthesis